MAMNDKFMKFVHQCLVRSCMKREKKTTYLTEIYIISVLRGRGYGPVKGRKIDSKAETQFGV